MNFVHQYFFNIFVLSCVIILSTVSSNSIVLDGNVTAVNSIQENDNQSTIIIKINTLIGNETKTRALRARGSLIINPDTGLRSRFGHKRHTIDSLLYVAYDQNGTVINRFPMRNLADVRDYFKSDPNIEICYDVCPDDDKPIP